MSVNRKECSRSGLLTKTIDLSHSSGIDGFGTGPAGKPSHSEELAGELCRNLTSNVALVVVVGSPGWRVILSVKLFLPVLSKPSTRQLTVTGATPAFSTCNASSTYLDRSQWPSGARNVTPGQSAVCPVSTRNIDDSRVATASCNRNSAES